MKIYTKLVIDMATDEVLEQESFEYQGPVAQCGGGSSGGAVGNSKDLMPYPKNIFAVETKDLVPVPGNQNSLEKYSTLLNGGGFPYSGFPIVNHKDGSNSPRFSHQEPDVFDKK